MSLLCMTQNVKPMVVETSIRKCPIIVCQYLVPVSVDVIAIPLVPRANRLIVIVERVAIVSVQKNMQLHQSLFMQSIFIPDHIIRNNNNNSIIIILIVAIMFRTIVEVSFH